MCCFGVFLVFCVLACERIFIKTHSTESRSVVGPEPIQARPCIFQPGNFTGWGNEEVNALRVVVFTTFFTCRFSLHDRYSCHVWPWMSEFGGAILRCFTLSRFTILRMYRSTKPKDSFNSLFKATFYSVSWVRKRVNSCTAFYVVTSQRGVMYNFFYYQRLRQWL